MQQFRPIFGVVNRYENACSYSELFQSSDSITVLLNIPVPPYSVVVLIADGHLGCKKAMEDIFPKLNADSTSTLHTTCWPHIRRNSLINNRSKMQ